MNTKEMLKIALRRGHSCFLSECARPATYMFHDSAAQRMLYLCDEHTYITHEREQLPDADQIREIVAFINSGAKASELLEAAAELIVLLQSWGMHQNGPLLTRDADTGKLVGGWAGEELEQLILKSRNESNQ